MRKLLVAGAVLLFLGLIVPPHNGSFVAEKHLVRGSALSCINVCNAVLNDIITLNPENPDGKHGWYVSPVEVTFHAREGPGPGASGLKYIYYQINSESWITHEIPGAPPDLPMEYDFSITIDDDGLHVVSFKAEDWVGNVGPIHSVEFKIDMTRPVVLITSPQAGYIYMFTRELMPRIFDKSKALIIGGLTATATASDGTSGVDYVTFITQVGSGEDAVSPYGFNLPSYFPFGQDTLSVSVTDVAGNSEGDGSVDYLKAL